jgi:hypothetical protein
MKIVKLQAENVKRLVAVEIAPDGNVVEITGANGQGKTSVLDSIWWALAGTSSIQAEPIRKGETKARIKLDLGEIRVERRFTESGSTLVVENADGARFPGPQRMLDSLLGSLSFDPLGFTRLKPREQFDELRRVAEIDVDLDALDGKNRGDFERRTDLNREAKAARARADGIAVPADAPEAPVDTAALMDEMAGAAQANAEIEGRRARRTAAVADLAKMNDEIDAKHREAARLTREANELTQRAVELQARLDAAGPLPEPVDVADLRRKIDAAAERNKGYAARQARAAALDEAQRLETEAAALTDAIAARNEAKAAAVARAKLPVPGLGLGDGVVTYNGVPLDQASGAEQLRVSLAIAMASNPRLRVIRITDGSLLDEASMALVAAMAAERDYQVWIERVDTSGRVGFVIEDGHARRAEGGAA